MKIHTKLVYDFKTGALLEDEHYEHVGEVAECKGGGRGGGDGGAQARQDAEDARVAAAVQRINEVFGAAESKPQAVDRTQFTKQAPQNNQNGLSGFANLPGNNSWSSPLEYLNMSSIGNKPQMTNVFDEAGYNAAVATSQAQANKLKGAATGRESLYSTIGADTTNKLMTDLNKERGLTERELNFNLARSGLSGGSRDIDSNREVLDTFNQGSLKASDMGRQTSNNARMADDGTRTDLISRVRAGLDEGSALQQSYEGLRNNASRARDEANAQSMGGFFSTIRGELNNQQYQQGFQQAQTQFQQKYPSMQNKDDNGKVR